MAAAPRAAVRAPRLMAAAYQSILDRMLADGFAPPRRRAKASRLRLLGALSALWRPMRGRTVHVVGAGVAGLSAAVRLAEAGLEVIVHEAAQAAGGRCRSYADQALGLVIDNGNHLLLSGNHAALDYLDRIGSLDSLSGPGAAVFDFADLKSGERWRLRLNEGRVPWWLFDRKRRAPGTALREYFAPLAMLSGRRRRETVAQAMSCAGPLYERLWRPLLLAGLNTDPTEGSAALAAGLMRETLGAGGRACHPLIAGRGLSRTFIDPALAFLAARGGTIRFGERVREIRFTGSRAVALEFESAIRDARRRRGGGDRRASLDRLGNCFPASRRPTNSGPSSTPISASSPPPGQPAILGVVNGLIEWLFAYPDRLSVTISNADRLIDRPREELAAWNLARGGCAQRPSGRAAALADRQGEARDLRGDAGSERQASPFPHAVGQYRACRRLDADRPARHDRRRGAFGL